MGKKDRSALCTAAIVAGFQNLPSWQPLAYQNSLSPSYVQITDSSDFLGVPPRQRNPPHQTCVFPIFPLTMENLQRWCKTFTHWPWHPTMGACDFSGFNSCSSESTKDASWTMQSQAAHATRKTNSTQLNAKLSSWILHPAELGNSDVCKPKLPLNDAPCRWPFKVVLEVSVWPHFIAKTAVLTTTGGQRASLTGVGNGHGWANLALIFWHLDLEKTKTPAPFLSAPGET